MKKVKLSFLVCFFVTAFSMAVAAQSPKSNWTKYDSGKVHYYDIGNRVGKAIIFIHGWTCNAEFWKDSYVAFPGYRLIAIDLPGHGKSDKPKTTYSMAYFARSIDAVMKQAKVKQAVLVGHSMGTPVIRQFYRIYPDRTLGLILVDGPLRPWGSKAEMNQVFEPLRSNYKENAPKFVDGLLQPIRSEILRNWIRKAMSSVPEHVGLSAMESMMDERIWTDDKINVPVLAIMAEDPYWKDDVIASYKTIAPNLDFQMWSGVSHFLMMEKPKEFNEAVKSFVVKNKLL